MELYKEVRASGLDLLAGIRAIRAAFNLDLIEAKDIACHADMGISLYEHQGNLAAAIEAEAAAIEDEAPRP